MAFIKNNSDYEIGNWVTTIREHRSLCGTLTAGSYVKIIGVDPVRGYAIEDKEGNRLIEIGWVI